MTQTTGLGALEARVREDLSLLDLPHPEWTIPRMHDGARVLEVAVIGGGMSGLTVTAALKMLGVPTRIFDRSPKGQEGPWVTTARMETLRTPKQLMGPALNIPSLTFRAWFEAQFGHEAWVAIDKIDRRHWMEYLIWYRRVLALDVRNEHAVEAVVPRGDGLVELHMRTPEGPLRVMARRVVLATGRDGLGGPSLPSFLDGVPRELWAHSSDRLDYGTLAGRRVAVVGAGASAMDCAATALESGAASVDILIRRADLPRINKAKGAGHPGLWHGHELLPDASKWKLRHYINSTQTPPPRDSVLRVSRHAASRFHFSCPVEEVKVRSGGLFIRTPRRDFDVDFLIVSTGFKVDWAARPEFAAFAPHVRLWSERYTPPEGEEDQELADSPDVGPGFELLERTPGACPGLSRIHCFCYAATLSHGQISGDIPPISDGARRLANRVVSLLYCEDFEEHFRALERYRVPELLGDEWVPADAAPASAPR